MNCPNCGAAIKEGKFCNYCGAKLPEEPKIDVKKRDYRFSFNSESSVRKAEIKKEIEAQRQEHAQKMTEQIKEINKQNNKILIGFAIAAIILFIFISLKY